MVGMGDSLFAELWHAGGDMTDGGNITVEEDRVGGGDTAGGEYD